MTTDVTAARLREMRLCGLRYVGARRDPELLSEACKFAFGDCTGYVLGIIFDRGEKKDHGLGRRIEAPHGYRGEPVYWLRKVTWT